MYPTIVGRMLLGLADRNFGTGMTPETGMRRVYSVDWGIDFDDPYMVLYRTFSTFIGVFYMFGIPAFFLKVLKQTAAPKKKPSLPPKESAQWDVLQLRRERRYSFLYEIYDEECWYWEVTELFRKLALTAMVQFLAPGTTTQMLLSMIIGLAFWIFSSSFSPFKDNKIDRLNFFSQMSTVGTLMLVLSERGGAVGETPYITEIGFAGFLVFLQLVPVIFGFSLIGWNSTAKFLSQRRAKKRLALMPHIRLDRDPAEKSKKSKGKQDKDGKDHKGSIDPSSEA